MESTYDESRLRAALQEWRRATARDFLFSFVRRLGGADLSLTHIGALAFLDEAESRRVGEVARAIGRSLPATSHLLDGLVRRGYATRDEDPVDRRARRMAITEEGRRLIGAIERERIDAQVRLMHGLSDDERVTVLQAQELLARAAREAAEEQDAA